MTEQLLAHTSSTGRVETLDEHSRRVAATACRLAKKFDADDLGYTAGLLHDLGKMKPGFQAKLRGEVNSISHSGEGARFVVEHYLERPIPAAIARLIAFAIAGHHAGLANGISPCNGRTPLQNRISSAESVQPWFPLQELPKLDRLPHSLAVAKQNPFAWAFFTRMLFSAVVDADFLETERWMAEAEGRSLSRGWKGELIELKNALDGYLNTHFSTVSDATEIARLRAEVLADCRSAAASAPGFFSLTVPTGGGKTLSSLAFALDHAISTGLDRVIYVIPFTSIVEQTADVFRQALGDDNAILEHHSAFDAEKLERVSAKDADFGLQKLRLAAHNWDRPIVVTTAVQFFESLFAARPGRCRKLHNIARSVVILDEAQTLPLKLLRPCLAALNELVRGYSTTVVLCTATQPAVTKSHLKAPEALDKVSEIISPTRNLFGRLKRVRAEVGATLSDKQLIGALTSVDQGLVIVNNRRHARELFEDMRRAKIEGARHLTTAMTAAHRQKTLDDIRTDLKLSRPVRLISTSLIEAGVDISFRTVWRAWAGLDQMVQAAGRCNRNGELGTDGGLLTIFEPEAVEGRRPPRELVQNAEVAKRVLRDQTDPMAPEGIEAYFRELLWIRDDGGKWLRLDDARVGERNLHGIIKAIDETKHGLNFPFADIADAFCMIEEVMVPVIIPATSHYAGGAPASLIEKLKFVPYPGGVARELQRFVVQIPRTIRGSLLVDGAAQIVREKDFGDQFVILTNLSLYDPQSGLRWEDPTFRKVEALII